MNALSDETSPYLLQHADNPVDWHPWNAAALDLARATGKPILLSIGYSACHWCHVMAHESFEDEQTAAVMNALYVNIKVDREERPDLDKIYQLAQQMFTGRAGGWPLTVFLAPDTHLPIFAGTYFPKDARYGLPAFREVLVRVDAYYRAHGDEIARNGDALLEGLAGLAPPAAADPAELTSAPLALARHRLGESFDARNGGFGAAPKFPHPPNLDFLLEHWAHSVGAGAEDTGALRMLTESLTRMGTSGLFDHLGGGFFRYCVDREWTIPHFEKMLYDNGALLATYADAYTATGDARYAEIARMTADWLLRDMRAPGGGFYGTLDADSEGHEGRFYVWRPAELDALLTPAEAAAAKSRYGLDGPANFEGEAWHLRLADTAQRESAGADEVLARARAKLLAARNARVWPGRDEKILVGWNALVIAGLAKAARALARPDLAEAATQAVDFLRARLWHEGRLRATFKDGRARFAAYLDDYALLDAALVELLQCRWRNADLELATDLLDVLLAHFADARGGFFFTPDDHEALIHRSKPLADESTPSGNAVAAIVLGDLGHLLGETPYLDAAESSLRAAWPVLARHPESHATYLRALRRRLAPPEIVVVRGQGAELETWRAAAQSGFRPARLVFAIPADAADLPGLLATRTPRAAAVAYVCTGMECRAPVTRIEELGASA